MSGATRAGAATTGREPRGDGDDRVPGEAWAGSGPLRNRVGLYALGYLLSLALTGAAFWAVGTDLIYRPAAPYALLALAIAQMGIHLVFFLHVTTGPDNTNNVLALAFGVLIVGLVVFGTVWIMGHLNRHESAGHATTATPTPASAH